MTKNTNRWTLVLSPNSNQWWVYDEQEDCYVDLGPGVQQLLSWLTYEDQRQALLGLCREDPEWLYDEENRYYGEI